ncbi:uncharacterized protein LOC120219494 [Hibiscus syriacus]|uniref:uncharacterized protein LOC120219494 n=1 Tax=Hibiscus syriacus TaxID=106335 RepID=UPI0019224062|nr:uncharacterized protein LOC120219494 [Hibiscus syriacus]
MKRDQLSECGGCGIPERFFLHNLRHRASYRRLCTNCVLKNHQGLFCPICLQVFNEPPPPYQRLICLKCPSVSHLSCSSSSSSISQSFTCPLCSNPNFSFFNLTSKKPKSTPEDPSRTTTTTTTATATTCRRKRGLSTRKLPKRFRPLLRLLPSP